MKKQIIKVALVDIAAITAFCLMSRYAESFFSIFERVGDYHGITSLMSKAAISLVIPVAYVVITKIIGTENDFLILWNMPLMALIAGLISMMIILIPAFAEFMPHYSLLMTFAISYCLSHGILRFSHSVK